MALFLFNKTLTPAQYTVADNNTELALALGATTLVNWTSTQTLTFIGLLATPGGNVDGMVVCFANNNSSAFSLTLAHESGSEPTPANRFRCPGLTSVTTSAGGGIWVRWNVVTARWHVLGKA